MMIGDSGLLFWATL